MSKEKNIEKALDWYVAKRLLFQNLANKVESIIKEVLDSSGITYYTISSRAKEIPSFVNKAKKEKYDDPINQIMDLAGIRVITFVKSEVYQCCEVIKPLFEIDDDNSIDKSKELGKDKVGYRSVHYIAKLSQDRLKLPEYKIYENMVFEIQIRTILEHAWADISHDRNYKFQGILPTEYDIERRFSLAAATLELVDREFDAISKELNQYEVHVSNKTESGDLDIEINTTSVKDYLSHKFKDYIAKGKIDPNVQYASKKVIEELRLFGVESLSDLDKLIGDEVGKYVFGSNNFTGLMRNIMLISDANKYFDDAWNENWKGIGINTIEHLDSLGIDIRGLIEKYELDVIPEY